MILSDIELYGDENKSKKDSRKKNIFSNFNLKVIKTNVLGKQLRPIFISYMAYNNKKDKGKLKKKSHKFTR